MSTFLLYPEGGIRGVILFAPPGSLARSFQPALLTTFFRSLGSLQRAVQHTSTNYITLLLHKATCNFFFFFLGGGGDGGSCADLINDVGLVSGR